MKTETEFLVVVLLALVLAWSTTVQAEASDPFTVNITTAGEQSFPDVAVGQDGRFVVVWRAEDQDGDGWGVFARWFDWKGEAVTGEVPVNVNTLGDQYSPKIGADGQGRFVVVWRDDAAGIQARRFNSFGAPLGGEIDVTGPAPVPFEPSLSLTDNGDFVVLWMVYDLPEIRVAARPARTRLNRRAQRAQRLFLFLFAPVQKYRQLHPAYRGPQFTAGDHTLSGATSLLSRSVQTTARRMISTAAMTEPTAAPG